MATTNTVTEKADAQKLMRAAGLAMQFGKYAHGSSAGGHDRSAFAEDMDKVAKELLTALADCGYTAG